MKALLFFIACLSLTSCFQAYSEEDELRAIPVTNNPHIIPSHGSSLPMMDAK